MRQRGIGNWNRRALVLAGFLPVLGLAGCEYHEHRREVVVEERPVVRERVEIVDREPPPPVTEVITVRPSPRHVWIGGHHVWEHGHYVWVGGHWALPPRRDAVWVPGEWRHEGRGYVWVEGRWR